MTGNAGEDARRIPDRSEIRDLLEKYFDGYITDAHVETIAERLEETADSVSKHQVAMRTYRGNIVHYRGCLWREERSHWPHAPRMVDLVPWFATTMSGFPPPRPYCPDPFVGRWEDIDDPDQHWEFSADGAFASNEPEVANKRAWCIVRKSEQRFAGDELKLRETQYDSGDTIFILGASPVSVALDRYGSGKQRTFRLRRIS